MRLHFPIPAPYAAGAYTRVERYNLSDSEPANWRLKILAESSAHFWLQAVCSGWLTAVPPGELVESEMAPLSEPGGTLPETISLYLEPNRAFAPQAGPPLPFLFQTTLEQANLGKLVKCYVYSDIDPNLFSAAIEKQIGLHAGLTKHGVTSPANRREMFASGQLGVWINGGDVIARSSDHNASAAGKYVAQFGVLTDIGLVDPIVFFETMAGYLHDPSKFSAFKNLFGTDWPFLAPAPPNLPVPLVTAADAINSAQQRLYPAPALYEAKQRLSLTDQQWGIVGNAQKALYWDQLLRSSGHSTTGTPFVFNVDDMGNPFQLEAVAEFFMAWPEPASGIAPPAPNPQQPPIQVNLQDGDWNLVLIDPFHHPTLGNPPLPKPDYHLGQHTAPNNVRCDSANPMPSPFNADTYAAVLFLVHHGEIKEWYRWTTYTSHKWEGQVKPTKKRPYLHLECELSSSIRGNDVFHLRSATASKDRYYINYGFLLSTVLNGTSVPARFYFRTTMPMDDGTVPNDAAANKTSVMIHIGESASKRTWSAYNGSGGCLVSPNFPRLRNTMIELFWQDELKKPAASRDTRPLFLRHLKHSQASAIHIDDKGRARDNNWNNKIRGLCYVIRPDEPTQK